MSLSHLHNTLLRRNRRGFTLVEMLVSTMIFTVLVMVLYGIIKTGTAVYVTDTTLLDLQQQARNGMDRMVRETRESRASSVTVIDASSDRFTFSTPTETNIRYYRSGTNLVREYPTGTTHIVALDIPHLKFTKTGVRLTIDLQAQVSAYNRTFTFPLYENVKLRNE